MSLPAFLTPQFVTSMIVILTVLHLAILGAAYGILLERRICAWVQDRIGPNRVGPIGLLQPLADGLKLIMKEEFMPRGADKALFIIAPALAVIPAMIGFAIIPWGGTLEDISAIPFIGSMFPTADVKIIGADVNIGLIYLVATASLGVYGVGLGGWASNNKFSFLGGLRATAQMISYEIPMGLALLCVILTAGTVRADSIVVAQVEGQWFLIQQPLVAILFYVCMLAEANRAPFDLAEAEQELIGGWHTEYSSMKWTLFFMGEYIHIFVGGAFFTVLFLGGWSLNPFFGLDLPAAGGLGLIMLQFGVMLGKVFLMMALTMLVRWTVPRFRFDQLMRLAWEGMIPLGLLLLLMTSVFVFFGWTEYLWAGSILTLAFILGIYPYLPKQSNPNHRLPMIGSRFCPVEEGETG